MPRVAVIGAGASGLVASRELRSEGHEVVVFERGDDIGGIWIYTPKTESDPLGIDACREIVHSSLYPSLRTNLPRELMGFQAFPFVPVDSDGRDPRRFPSHREVLCYLKDFADHFHLHEMIKFQTEVVRVTQIGGNMRVTLKMEVGGGQEDDDLFDAVVVCSGHFTKPHISHIPGIDTWPGKLLHSHNYRIPEPFCDQVVLIIGNSSSSADISWEIAGVAREVHVAVRSGGESLLKHNLCNIRFHSMIKSAGLDGSVVFEEGDVVLHPDVIIHCTGYEYKFPFLETGDGGVLRVEDGRVGPLYQHVFPPSLAPKLSFVGLACKVVPFPLCELQSRWVAGVLSGKIVLPSEEEMMKDIEVFYQRLEANGTPKRHTHTLSSYQFEYMDWISRLCKCPPMGEWREKMYTATGEKRAELPATYRDEWDDDELMTNFT